VLAVKKGNLGRLVAEMLANFPVSPLFGLGPNPKTSEPPPQARGIKVLMRKQLQFKPSVLTDMEKKQEQPQFFRPD